MFCGYVMFDGCTGFVVLQSAETCGITAYVLLAHEPDSAQTYLEIVRRKMLNPVAFAQAVRCAINCAKEGENCPFVAFVQVKQVDGVRLGRELSCGGRRTKKPRMDA